MISYTEIWTRSDQTDSSAILTIHLSVVFFVFFAAPDAIRNVTDAAARLPPRRQASRG